MRKLCLLKGLALFAADARNLHHVSSACLLNCQLQHRAQKSVLRITNRKLRGVDADGEASCSGGQVVAGESALAALIEFAFRGQGQRMRGNYKPRKQSFAYVHQNCPSRVAKWVGFSSVGPPFITQSATQSTTCIAVTLGQPRSSWALPASLSNAVSLSSRVKTG